MKPKSIHHIAVMRLSAMGDVAMIVPALRCFVRQYPEVYLTVVSRPFFKPFFQEIPNIIFFEFDDKGRHKGILGLTTLFKDLKKLKVDAFLDLHCVLRSKFISYLFKINNKKTVVIDKGRKDKKQLVAPKNKVFKQLKSVFERQLNAFEELGFLFTLDNPVFPKKREVSQKITFNFSKTNIGIAPFAQYESKIYPLDLMQKVIEELTENYNTQIYLFGGGKKEIELLNTLKNKNSSIIIVAEKLSFTEEINLISNLDVMLSMDSGNAHIAAMMGIKVVTLWGATHPYAGFLPFNQPIENCLVSDRTLYPMLPTSVCGNKKITGYHDAMRTILPEMVVNKIRELTTTKTNL